MKPKEILENLAAEFNKPLTDLTCSIAEHYTTKILESVGVPGNDAGDAIRTICSLIGQAYGEKMNGQ